MNFDSESFSCFLKDSGKTIDDAMFLYPFIRSLKQMEKGTTAKKQGLLSHMSKAGISYGKRIQSIDIGYASSEGMFNQAVIVFKDMTCPSSV